MNGRRRKPTAEDEIFDEDKPEPVLAIRGRKKLDRTLEADRAGEPITPFSGKRGAPYDAANNPEQRVKQRAPAADFHEEERKIIKRKKAEFLSHLEGCMGIVSNACRLMNMRRSVYDYWLQTDPEFNEEVKRNIKPNSVDYAHAAILKKIKEGDASCIQFYLRTQGASEGFGNTVSLTGANGGPIAFDPSNMSAILKEELPLHSIVAIMKEALPRLEALHGKKKPVMER